MDNINYIISRLEEALERQQNTEGKIPFTPTVEYCIECDNIYIDQLVPDACFDHTTFMSDGYEHGGIQSTLRMLEYLEETD